MYLYAGDRETGIETVRRLMYDLVCRHGYAFDLPNMLYCDTGERWFGTDYYQDMMFWAMPAAIARKDLHAPCVPGGLVDRVLQAAKRLRKTGQHSTGTPVRACAARFRSGPGVRRTIIPKKLIAKAPLFWLT